MGIAQKVVIITGASQGMGAALVEAYRHRDYGGGATSRSIRPTNDDQILVAPGVIKTPMHPVETHAQLAKLHPLGRMGEISEIVGAILYLESAGFVTGETIHVDGGQSAGH